MSKFSPNIYLHGINPMLGYDSGIMLKTLSQILSTKYLLSLRLQNKPTNYGFNGLDYISLCDYEKRHLFNQDDSNFESNRLNKYNAYNKYVKNSLAIVFPKESLQVITPIITEISIIDKAGYQRMKELGESSTVRYSDMPDEVQVKDKISLDIMTGITYPFNQICDFNKEERIIIKKIIQYLNKINNILIANNYQVPIYDIDTLIELTDETSIKRLIRTNNQNKKY